MNEIKKLFRRDKWFLIVAILFILVIFSIWGTTCQKTVKSLQLEIERINGELIASEMDFTLTEADMNEMLVDELNQFFIMLVQMMGSGMLILQIIKWQMFEGQKARKLQQILPVKISTYITYDYLLGLLFGWLPTILLCVFCWGTLKYPPVEDMAVFLIMEMLMYSLFVFSKNVTNHILGAFLFSELLIYFELTINTLVFKQESLAFTWALYNYPMKTQYVHLVVYTVLSVLFVGLSYVCGKNRDLSGNGMFSYKTVHYIALTILLILLILLLGSVYYVGGTGQVAWRILLVAVLAIGITGGIHYLIRPKKI